MDRLRRYWPALFLLIVPLLVLAPAFANGTIGAFDQIRQMAPWNGPEPAQPWDVLQADSVLQFYPWRDLVLSAWGHGQLPFWNPYQLAGTPLLANSQSAGFYPPHILLGLLHVPTPVAINLLAWFHLSWAGLGLYSLVRRLGGTQLGGAIAGASFSCSAFMLGWTPLASVITTVSWIPWVLACIVATFTEDPLRLMTEQEDPTQFQQAEDQTAFAIQYATRQSRRQTRGARVSLALIASTAMMILGGHLQFVAYGFLSAAILAIALLVLSPRCEQADFTTHTFAIYWRHSGRVATGTLPNWLALCSRPLARVLFCLVVGVLLAAPQLLPVLNYSQFSHRRNTPNEQGYAAYVGSAIAPQDFLARLANPFAQGDPTEAIAPDQPSTFWPAISRPGANFAESASTIGPVVLLLLCLLPLLKTNWRVAGGMAAVTVVSLLLAIGTPLNQLLYFYAPGWSSTGSPGRILVIVVLGACALAGLAMDEKLLSVPRKHLAYALVGFALLLALTMMPTSAPTPAGINPDVWSTVVAKGNSSGLIACVIVTLFAVGILVSAAYAKNRTVWHALMVTPIAAALFMAHAVRSGDPSFLTPSRPNQERITALNQPWGLSAAAPAILPPNTASAMRIHDLAGYDSLLHRDTVALLHGVDGQDPAPDANGNIMFVKPSADPAKLGDAGVTSLWSRKPWGAGKPTNMESGYAKYRVPGPGRITIASGSAKIVDEGLDRLTIELAGSGHLILRDRNLPGWSATIDGKPAPIAGATWREFEVPEGAKILEMRYSPPGFKQGVWLFLVGVLLAMPSLIGLRRLRLRG